VKVCSGDNARSGVVSSLRARRQGVTCLLLPFLLFACSREPTPEVVLYTSCDDYILREVIPAFEKETGITVKLAGDTEATKTTGLVQRLIAERDQPRADVWWSNEAFGTIKLAEEGLLTTFQPAALADFGGTWPTGYAAADGSWYGYALRARVMVFNTARVKPEDAPRGLADLTNPKWKGRVGMARPQFGTTRGHMAAIVAACGEPAFRDWLGKLKANGLRLYDGNSAVVRAAAQGEIDIGLTDTDDVTVGQREKWPVAMIVEKAGDTSGLCDVGPVSIPNTVAVVKGAPHGDAARKLADYLLSARVERVLAQSESRNLPIRPALAQEMRGSLPILTLPIPNLSMIHGSIPAAMNACDDILGDG
jgi:iron(III) transport system substrate-binding protein